MDRIKVKRQRGFLYILSLLLVLAMVGCSSDTKRKETGLDNQVEVVEGNEDNKDNEEKRSL